MKSEIISLLRERQDYVSGQELCERFGVSRTAVWKAVEQLKKEGYCIRAVRNRGYLLEGAAGAAEIYSQHEIASRIKSHWAGCRVLFLDTVDSTNARAKLEAEQGAPHGTLVVADMQTAGRGRRGRGWSSPAGTNVYFTLLLRPDIAPDKASMLTLVMAHAVAEGIRQTAAEQKGTAGVEQGAFADAEIGIKWPNDIVVDGRKVCGILTEMNLSVEQGTVEYVVIGVGVNVRDQAFGPELADRAVSLDEALDCRIDRSALIAEIMEVFEADYQSFADCGDLSGLRDTYNAMLVNAGREVCVLDPRGEYRGTARGINDAGELLVELPDGRTAEVYAGEVSVRGVYGYV